MKDKKEKILNVITPIFTVVLILLVWTAVAFKTDNEFILPSVSETLREAWKLLGEREFYLSLSGTLLRSLIAFTTAFLLAVILSLTAKRSKIAEKIISPFISIMRALPTVAVILLLLFWTNKQVAPVCVTLLVVLPTLYQNVKNSLDSVDERQLVMCKVFGVKEKDVLRKVKLPQIAPPLTENVGAGFSLNLKLMVAAEVISATGNSLGNMLNVSKYNVEIAQMIALVCFTVVIGIVVEKVFYFIAKGARKWAKRR